MTAKENKAFLYLLIVIFSGLLYYTSFSEKYTDPPSSSVRSQYATLDEYRPSTFKRRNDSDANRMQKDSQHAAAPPNEYLTSGFCGGPPTMRDPAVGVREIIPAYVPVTKYPCYWITFSNSQTEALIGTQPLSLCLHNPRVDKGTSGRLMYGDFDKPTAHQLFTFSNTLCTQQRPTVIIVGGGVGVTGLLAATTFGCKVVAMEPIEENSYRMALSIIENSIEDQITILDIALDHKWHNDHYSFLQSDTSRSGNIFPPREYREVTIGTLDGITFSSQSFIRPEHQFSSETIHTIVFDTYNMNVLAFIGSLHTITSGKVPLIVIYTRPADILEVSTCLQEVLTETIFSGDYDVFADNSPITSDDFREWLYRDVYDSWMVHLRLQRRGHHRNGPLLHSS